ncbi:hypothetical protein G7046_g8243 [Stylonectria norvegica]|nr:hypothetical protein G7046_g8243 [Stylonectria norvegica]
MADESEYTESDIWASPNHQDAPPDSRTEARSQSRPRTPKTPKTPKTPAGNDRTVEPVDHEAALRKELEGVRGINTAIEGVIGTLERAGGNMETVFKTVNNASILLNTWTRILSQTEHNQRLILNPQWKGATEDVAEQEAEVLQRQLVAERRAAEEEQRREDLRRRREEEEQRRMLASSTPVRGSRGARGTRGRGRATARGGTGSSYMSESSVSSLASGRGTSNIGRGLGTTRGRSRAPR